MGTPNLSKQIVMRAAANARELAKLYRFRYEIYVQEMGRKQKHADHLAMCIQDPLDSFATNLIAVDAEGRLIGTIRTNFARDGHLGEYETFYAMESAGDDHPRSTSICTRLMIAPEYRGSMLAVRLSLAAYELGLQHGIRYNFIDCNAHLVPFFEGLGFVQHVPRRHHEEYGLVTCMRLALHDRRHLESLSSPFVMALDRWQAGIPCRSAGLIMAI